MTDSSHIDAYLQAKSLQPRVLDEQWDAIIAEVIRLFGRELKHRSRWITQQEDPFRRYSTQFPDGLRTPFRHLYCVELLLSPSTELDELHAWLTSRAIRTEWCLQVGPEYEAPSIAGIRIFGFDAQG